MESLLVLDETGQLNKEQECLFVFNIHYRVEDQSINIEPPVQFQGDQDDFYQKSISIARQHFQVSSRLYQEVQVQHRGVHVLSLNLQLAVKQIAEHFQTFIERANKEFHKHHLLLEGFDQDMDLIHLIPIHSLIAPGKTLGSYVPAQKLIPWHDRCKLAHEHLKNKTKQVESVVQGLLASIPPLDQATINQTLEQVQEAVTKMESKKESIQDMQKYDRFIRDTVLYLYDSKIHASQLLQTRIRQLIHHQSTIAQLPSTIHTMNQALHSQSEAFLQLLHLHRMVPAYGASQVEIVRRKEFTRVFLNKVKEMADVLSSFRAMEDLRRENFKQEILRYLPSGLIQGLEDRPPVCEIAVSNTKDNLPQLQISDLDGFTKTIAQLVKDEKVQEETVAKLQSTMTKMSHQIEMIPNDFERLMTKTFFPHKLQQLEQENIALKEQLASQGDAGSLQQRLLELEQENAQLKARNNALEQEKTEMDALYKQALEETQEHVQKWQSANQQVEKMKPFLEEVQDHLVSCMRSMHPSSPISSSPQIDDLRRMMRLVEDDVIAQMAVIADFESNTKLSQGGQTVANEMVNLFQRVGELENILHDEEDLLTVTQAREAVLEADLESTKKLLEKTQRDLEACKRQYEQLQKRTQEDPKKIPREWQLLHLKAREQLDDLCIVLRLSMEQLEVFLESMFELATSLAPSRVNEQLDHFSFKQVMELSINDTDFESLLQTTQEFAKQSYEKIMKLEHLHQREVVSDIKLNYETLAVDSYKRLSQVSNKIAFQNFQQNDLVLFLPLRNKPIWQAFNVNHPNVYLDLTEVFQEKKKYLDSR
ncbi:hypothetical protein EDD86DRAFT_201364 [Gorgonomyces haynaldii]|nr:hypothetical protein EDD86DRAFT_201364 [Gorgonomyces haynaldii]